MYIYIYISSYTYVWIALLCVVECRILWFYVLKVSLSFELQFADLQKPQLQRCRECLGEGVIRNCPCRMENSVENSKTFYSNSGDSDCLKPARFSSTFPLCCFTKEDCEEGEVNRWEEGPKVAQEHPAWSNPDPAGQQVPRKARCFLEAVGEWPALGHRSLCPQWCAIEASEPAILHRH